MSQLNIYASRDFLKDLKNYMKLTGVTVKSEALRRALREALNRLKASSKGKDYRSWLGLTLKANPARSPRFKSEDDLW